MYLDDDNNIYIKQEDLHLLGVSNLKELKIGIPRVSKDIYDASNLSNIIITP
jgi:hypothetical protein